MIWVTGIRHTVAALDSVGSTVWGSYFKMVWKQYIYSTFSQGIKGAVSINLHVCHVCAETWIMSVSGFLKCLENEIQGKRKISISYLKTVEI